MSGDTTQSAAPPGEILHPTSMRRILGTAAVMLAVAMLIDAVAVWGLARHPLNHGYRVIRAKWSLLMQQRRPVDTLVLGDSTGNQGVVPDILGARLGGAALNLCTVGDLLAVNDAWMLDRYLRTVGTPRRVVVVHAFDVWGRSHNPDAIAQVPLPLGFWNDVRPKVPLTAWESLRVLLDRYVPLYSQDQTLSRFIRQPRRTLARGFDMDARGFLRAHRGLPEEVLKDSAFQIAQVEREKGEDPLSAENEEALDVLAKLGEEHGFDVYVSHSPLYEGLYADPGFQHHLARLDEALAAIAATHPRLRPLAGPPKTFPAEQMTTVDHLIEQGAHAFTESLAERIEAVSRPPASPPENRPHEGPGR